MSRRRGTREQKEELVLLMRRGVDKPTNLMYKANLSWNLMNALLKTLVKEGYVEEKPEGSRRTFHLSRRGLELAELLAREAERFPEFGVEL